jgi:hypothetical protein
LHFVLSGGSELWRLSLISSSAAAAIWAKETWIIWLSSVRRNQDSIDKAQSELAPTSAPYTMDHVWTRNTSFGVVFLSHSWPLEFSMHQVPDMFPKEFSIAPHFSSHMLWQMLSSLAPPRLC